SAAVEALSGEEVGGVVESRVHLVTSSETLLRLGHHGSGALEGKQVRTNGFRKGNITHVTKSFSRITQTKTPLLRQADPHPAAAKEGLSGCRRFGQIWRFV